MFNRLIAVEENSVTIAEYTYDYSGKRIAEYDGNDTLLRKFICGPGIDEAVCMITVDGQNETRYYYHYDGLGSVIALSNINGDIAEAYSYDVFGSPTIYTAAGADGLWRTADDTTASASAIGNPYLFTGRRYDDESGLYYYRARMYAPNLGRFMQTDPIGYADSMNLYAYCGNNPVVYIDPYGEARRQERPLDMWPLRFITWGKLHHDRYIYNDGTDSGYYSDSTVREDRADQKLQNRYVDIGPEFDDQLLHQAEDNLRPNWDQQTNPNASEYVLKGKDRKNCQDYGDVVEDEYQRLQLQKINDLINEINNDLNRMDPMLRLLDRTLSEKGRECK